MKNLFAVSILLLFVFPYSAFAGLLKGKITDEKGEPLPFATIFIQGTASGTSANAVGEYQLSLEPGTYKITTRYIGFAQSVFTVTINGNETVTHHFTLYEEALEMKEVVVRSNDEDPAYRIMREVIKKRSEHLKQVKSFQTSIYLKAVLRARNVPDKVLGQKVSVSGGSGLDSNRKGVLYFCEELADYYARNNKERTVIHSVKESGNPNGLGFSQLPPVITFYENNVQLFDELNPRGFVSPVADGAFNFYRYKLLGEFSENDNIIYKIDVRSKRQYEPTFQGTIYIVNEDWAIHSLDLILTSKSNMELLDTMRIEQVFLPLQKDVWVIKNQVLYPVFGIFGFDFTGNFVTVYDKQKVNEPVPDTVFNDKIVSIYDKTANKKDSVYWNSTRPMQLEEDEAKDYYFKDSIRKKLNDPAYKDSLRRRGNRLTAGEILYNGVTISGKAYKQTWNTNAILTAINYNSVEGVNIAPKIWWKYIADTGITVNSRAAFRYSFNNKHFNVMTGLSITHADREWKSRSWTLGAEGGKYVFQFNRANPIEPLFNTFSTLLYNQNYMKIYERAEGALKLSMNYGNGLKWQAKISYQHRYPSANTTDYSWSKTNANYTDNTPNSLNATPWEAHNAVLASVSVSYQPGFTYALYPDYKMPQGSDLPVITLNYEKGFPNIFNSKSDFDKWRIGINDDVRLKLFGSFSYNIAAGGFLNRKYVSTPDLMHLNGNRIIVASPYLQSFQLAPYYQFSNAEKIYGEAHVEYYLRGLLTNKIPLLRQAHWYLLFGSNAFYANQNLYYVEAFAGVDNLGYKLFRFLRVDFVYGWDAVRQGFYGVRLGIRNNGIVNVNLDNSGDEW